VIYKGLGTVRGLLPTFGNGCEVRVSGKALLLLQAFNEALTEDQLRIVEKLLGGGDEIEGRKIVHLLSPESGQHLQLTPKL
jgi:hypothetical protein